MMTKKEKLKFWIGFTVICLSAAVGLSWGFGWLDRAEDDLFSVTDLTKLHYRLVWNQDQHKNNDVFGLKPNMKLMGYDSNDGKGEREIISDEGSYAKPLFTPDGKQIVFHHYTKPKKNIKSYIVNWDGSGLRAFANGRVIETWRDPKSKEDWVYVQENPSPEGHDDKTHIFRYRLPEFTKKELVWDGRIPVSRDNFQLSADGKFAGGQFPWPDAGIASMEKMNWTKMGKGCWTSLAPDNSYRFWIFDGSHRHVTMFAPDAKKSWQVPVNTAAELKGHEVYHPRWSNHPRFFTVTGPYKIKKGGGYIRGGGDEVEIFIGRFNENFTKVEKWMRITHNQRADFLPDLWFGGVSAGKTEAHLNPSNMDLSQVNQKKTSDSWPINTDRLLFVWDNERASNEVSIPGGEIRACSLEPKGKATYTRFFGMNLTQGSFISREEKDYMAPEFQNSSAITMEALLTPRTRDQNGAIVKYTTETGELNFQLEQNRKDILFKLRLSESPDNTKTVTAKLASLADSNPFHIMITYHGGHLRCALNGAEIYSNKNISGDLTQWQTGRLIFGTPTGDNGSWSGSIEAFALYSRAKNMRHAQASFKAATHRLQTRKPPQRVEVEAKLIEISMTPTLKAIAPYTRALVVYAYEVERVLQGELSEKEILVAHWAILDSKTILANRHIGNYYPLVLEPFEAHPELEGERLIMNTDVFSPEMFYDTSLF